MILNWWHEPTHTSGALRLWIDWHTAPGVLDKSSRSTNIIAYNIGTAILWSTRLGGSRFRDHIEYPDSSLNSPIHSITTRFVSARAYIYTMCSPDGNTGFGVLSRKGVVDITIIGTPGYPDLPRIPDKSPDPPDLGGSQKWSKIETPQIYKSLEDS